MSGTKRMTYVSQNLIHSSMHLCSRCLYMIHSCTFFFCRPGNELVNFALMVSSERNSAYLDEDDVRRNSVVSTVSTDSGIEGDMPISEISSLMLESQGGAEEHSSSFCRRPCVRWPKAGTRLTLMMEAIKGNGGYGITKEERNLTARIVVMGDDRTLGRLAKALYTIR